MMFLASLNKAASRTFVRAAPQQYLSRWLSTTEDGDYVYGTVKLYFRKKAYGFIIPDGGDAESGDNDVFIHNSGIVGTELTHNNSMFPFLKSEERVRFTLNPADPTKENARPHAANVTYEDGSKIPNYRPDYIDSAAKFEWTNLGQAVHDIFEDDAIDNKFEAIQEAHTKSKVVIADSQARYVHFNEHGTYTANGGEDNEEPTV